MAKTIQIQIPDEVLIKFGKKALENRFKKFAELHKLQIVALSIKEALDEAGLDNDLLWQKARTEAWDEFKNQHLKDILK